MGSEWPTATIEELAEKVAMGPFGSDIRVDTFVSEGVPVISGQHLHGFRLDDSVGFNFVAVEHATRLAGANVRRGDVIFTHAGNIGQVAYIPGDSAFDRYVISQRQFYMRCDSARVLPEYVTYYFSSRDGRHQLLANSTSVGVPSLARPVSYLRGLRIPVPPLDEQRRIASILGALDDKIELNRRMSRALDEMAQVVFLTWRSRSGDSFPAGTLGDLVDLVRDAVDPSTVDRATRYVALEHFDGGCASLWRWAHAADANSGKSRFCAGDILFGKLRPYFHKVAVAPFAGVCSTDVMVLRPKTDVMRGVVLGYVNSNEFIDAMSAQSEGTRMPRAKWADVAAYPARVPSADDALALQAAISPLIDRQRVLVIESRALERIRGTLLPGLLAGRVVPAGVRPELTVHG